MNKKAFADQPFIYIMGVIVTVLVLTFGIKAITSIRGEAELVETATFMKDIDHIVETFYNLNVGSSKEISLAVPKGIKMICFTAPKQEITAQVAEEIAYLARGNDNLFLFDGQIGPREIPHLEAPLDENPLCFNTQGKLKAVVETKSRDREVYVEISR
jgi:hypothetical protein